MATFHAGPVLPCLPEVLDKAMCVPVHLVQEGRRARGPVARKHSIRTGATLSPSRPSLSALHWARPELQGVGAGREVHTTVAVPHPHKVDMWTPVIFTNDLYQQ